MKRVLLGIFLFSIVLQFSSCQQFKGYEKTESGLYYTFISKSDSGQMPEADDLMRVSISYAFDDTVLYNSLTSGEPVIILNKGSRYLGDVNEGINFMREGDSVSFWTRTDSFFIKTLRKRPLPKIAQENEYIKIDVKLLGTYTREEYEQYQEAEAEENRILEPIVFQKYLVDNNINISPRESGLYFWELEAGEGDYPQEGDQIHIHFEVERIDGTKVYTSYDREPYIYTIGTDYECPGVVEGFSLMRKGGKSKLLFKSDIGFGEIGKGRSIPPYSSLIYHLEIKDIKRKADIDLERNAERIRQEARNKKNKSDGVAFLNKNANQPGVVTLPSGLQYKVDREGKGPQPKAKDRVSVHYRGTRIDGTVFDESYKRNRPSKFFVNKVIPGWSEALQKMPVGSKWTLYVPEELAYGDNPKKGGIIEPYDALIFEVELLEILPHPAYNRVKVTD
jgi:FKBP-type peptidyl-prolyl cis-trans isomerase